MCRKCRTAECPVREVVLARRPLIGKLRCLDNYGRYNASGNPIAFLECNAATISQVWSVPGDGSVRILGKCLDLVGYGTAKKTKVQLWDCAGTGNQQWRQGANNSLVNPASGRCLDAPAPVGSQLEINDCHGGANQSWTLDTTARGAIRGAFPGKCLDNYFGSSAIVEIWDCNGGPTTQLWAMLDDQTIRINGKCLDVDTFGGGLANGSMLQLWSCHGGSNQKWQVGPNFSLMNPVSGRCMDLVNANTTNGTRLQLWDCNGQAQQQWYLP